MATDKFNDGDRVFAKMKGYPAWPALVKERTPGKIESYVVFFYGTYQSAKVKPDCMYPYNDETKAKFGKANQRKGGSDFKLALEQIENNFEFEKEPEPEMELPPPPIEPEEEEVGELVIDEDASLPPVLKREGKVTPNTVGKKAPAKKAPKVVATPVTPAAVDPIPAPPKDQPVATPAPPAKAPRRNSKAGKKDLDLLNLPTPEPPVTPATPQPEVTSRCGRRIKPKKFADEEVEFSTPASKAAGATDAKSSEGPPAKRLKRVSTGKAKTPAPTTTLTGLPEPAPASPSTTTAAKTEVKTLPPPPPLERPKLPARKVGNTKRKRSTGNAAVVDAAPPPTETPTTTRPPPPLRAMPTLTPAPTSSSPDSVVKTDKTAVTKVENASLNTEKTELKVNSSAPEVESVGVEGEETTKIEGTEESLEEQTQGLEAKEGEHSPQSSKHEDMSSPTTPDAPPSNEAHESDDEGTEKENLQDEEQLANYENGLGDDSDEAPTVSKKMKVDMKNGTASVILGFNHDRPGYFQSDAAAVEYDMTTARSVLHAKVQLEVNETSFLKTVSESLPSGNQKEDKEAKLRLRTEEIQKKVAQLRMEGEIVEIIGELVGSLGVKFALCDRALDLLDKLGSRTDINTLALKKNPEVVTVIRQIQNYHGNISYWKNLNQAQIEDFHVKAEMIREKAISIYQSFKHLFCTTADKPFYETFNDEVGKFNSKVAAAGIPSSSVIGIYVEPAAIEKAPLESSESTPSTIVGDTNGLGEGEVDA